MGTLRTSEEGSVVAGEGKKSEAADENRRVDDGGPKIVITPGPMASAAESSIATAPPVPRRSATPAPLPAEKRGGLGLVIVLYLLAGAALAYAIYERFF